MLVTGELIVACDPRLGIDPKSGLLVNEESRMRIGGCCGSDDGPTTDCSVPVLDPHDSPRQPIGGIELEVRLEPTPRAFDQLAMRFKNASMDGGKLMDHSVEAGG